MIEMVAAASSGRSSSSPLVVGHARPCCALAASQLPPGAGQRARTARSRSLLIVLRRLRLEGRVERRAPDDPVRGPIRAATTCSGGCSASWRPTASSSPRRSALGSSSRACLARRGAAALPSLAALPGAQLAAPCSAALAGRRAPAPPALDLPARLRRRPRLHPADRLCRRCRSFAARSSDGPALAEGRRACPARTCCPRSDWDAVLDGRNVLGEAHRPLGPRRRRSTSSWPLVVLQPPGVRLWTGLTAALPRRAVAVAALAGPALGAARGGALPHRHGRHGPRRRADGVGLVRWQPREKAAALAKASRQADPLRLHGGLVRPVQAARPRLGRRRRSPTGSTPPSSRRASSTGQREDGRNPPDIAELQRRFEIVGLPDRRGGVRRRPPASASSRATPAGTRLMQFLEDPGRRRSDASRPRRPQSSSSSASPSRHGPTRARSRVERRTTTGPSPSSSRLWSSSQVRRASAQASPRHENGEWPSDSTTVPDR